MWTSECLSVQKTGWRHIDVSRFAVERDLCERRDAEHDCLILDEDQVVANMLVRSQMRDRACHQVCDALEEIVCHGGCLVDYHSCDFFPERSHTCISHSFSHFLVRWFDLILVLQTDNTLLYDRLAKRGYSEQKIQENVTCEIMHVLVEEARESYREECVQVLKSDSVEEMDTHVEHLCRWIEQNTHL